MTDMKKWSILLACAMFAGCAGLNAQRREARAASEKYAEADLAVNAARQAGAKTCAPKELKLADTDLQMAKGSLEKKDYGVAVRFAGAASVNAAAAVAKCNEAKKKPRKK